MAINSNVTSVDVNPFLAKNIIEDYIEEEKKRAKRTKSDADPEKHFDAERIAPLIRHIALAGIGGVIGHRMSGGDIPKPMGAYLGSLAGFGTSALASAAALVGSAITRRRKMKDQIKSDEKGLLAKYLIPGIADYDGAKRYESAKYNSYSQEKDAYAYGFARAANARGVDPVSLAKYASKRMSEESFNEDELMNEYIRQKRISAIKNALIAAAIGGLGGGALTAKGGGDAGAILGAGATSAAASGLTTYLLNRFSD